MLSYLASTRAVAPVPARSRVVVDWDLSATGGAAQSQGSSAFDGYLRSLLGALPHGGTVVPGSTATSVSYVAPLPPPQPPPLPPPPTRHAAGWFLSFLFSGDVAVPTSGPLGISWQGYSPSAPDPTGEHARSNALASQAAYNYFAQVAYPDYVRGHGGESSPFHVYLRYYDGGGNVLYSLDMWSNQTGP